MGDESLGRNSCRFWKEIVELAVVIFNSKPTEALQIISNTKHKYSW